MAYISKLLSILVLAIKLNALCSAKDIQALY
jgi:hypothetical protein